MVKKFAKTMLYYFLKKISKSALQLIKKCYNPFLLFFCDTVLPNFFDP
jgi:hypothetical protein